MHDIQRALMQVRDRIAEACLRANRDPASVRLIAVTKTFPIEAVLEAATAGQRDFGENRVEEALAKMALLQAQHDESRLNWHLIGHLQSRKARDAAGCFHLIHSVDSLRLANKLSAACAAKGCSQDVLLECNVSGEASKYGFSLAGWERDDAILDAFTRDLAQILALPHVRVRGLMTMAPIVARPEQARPAFASLRALRNTLRERFPHASWDHLSMGMTDDFEIAIAEGATLVRIGRAIFGSRG